MADGWRSSYLARRGLGDDASETEMEAEFWKLVGPDPPEDDVKVCFPLNCVFRLCFVCAACDAVRVCRLDCLVWCLAVRHGAAEVRAVPCRVC